MCINHGCIYLHVGLPGNIPTNNIVMCIERLQGGFGGVLASMKGISKFSYAWFCEFYIMNTLLVLHVVISLACM